jgi:hypothetical protein
MSHLNPFGRKDEPASSTIPKMLKGWNRSVAKKYMIVAFMNPICTRIFEILLSLVPVCRGISRDLLWRIY